jgi:hypothetical protein
MITIAILNFHKAITIHDFYIHVESNNIRALGTVYQ